MEKMFSINVTLKSDLRNENYNPNELIINNSQTN